MNGLILMSLESNFKMVGTVGFELTINRSGGGRHNLIRPCPLLKNYAEKLSILITINVVILTGMIGFEPMKKGFEDPHIDLAMLHAHDSTPVGI
jgi:hypothetical protein